LYQDGVIQISDLKYSFKAPDESTVSFKMTKNGAPFDARQADNLSIYFVPYSKGNFQFDPPAERLSLKGAKLNYDGNGGVTTSVTKTVDYSQVDGLVVVYGRDDTLGTMPNSRVAQAKYPFAALLETGKGVDYASVANNAGCEKCHSIPYLKHGYIYGQVNHDKTTDFYTCKACHLDNGAGGHYEWQLLVNDPPLAAKYLSASEEEAAKMLTDQQKADMAYTTSVMNDVHMSHAMEFPYPQSMSNCVTCHEGKLDKVLADANFTIVTCKSCHPMAGAKAPVAKEGDTPAYDTTKLALKTILPEASHGKMDLAKTDCTMCHKAGGAAPSFKQIHSGYDKMIYNADGLKYSDAISVTIQTASFANNKLSFTFSAAESPDVKGVDVAAIKPTVLVGLYGYDTKDFIIGPHERLIDDNKDGVLDSKDSRNLEAAAGDDKHPRIKTVSAAGGKWEMTADLTPWADLIKNGTVKRVEIGVMPALMVVSDTLAIDAKSRTFDLTANKFDDKAFSPIATAQKCENCHAALATNFHSPSYGGSVTVCRMCHITKSGGAHLEMASRSLDSYVHAIHAGQAFDVANIDFKDPVAAMHYEHHIGFPYPTHGEANCESCHVKGAYDVPDQSASLPGVLSASAEVKSMDRKVGVVPSVVAGPASRACGGCHRAELINEDSWSELVSFNLHSKQGGYQVEAGKDPLATLQTVIAQIMPIFQ